MKKNRLGVLFWVSLVFTFVLIEFIAVYYSLSPLPHTNTLEGEVPRVSWFHVATGKWTRNVLRSFDRDSLNNNYSISNYSVDPDTVFDEFGKKGIFVLMEEVQVLIDLGKDAKPYRMGGFAKTNIDGEEYLVAAQIWKNKSGTIEAVTYVFPLSNEDAWPVIQEGLQFSSNFFLRPVVYFRDFDSCKVHLFAGNNFCEWQHSQTLIRKAILNWWEYFDNIPRIAKYFPMSGEFVNLYNVSEDETDI